MQHKPIGILDSGVGGLSVYQHIIKLLPHESTVYIGDNALAPYGKLSEETIYERSKRLTYFLLDQDVKAIVVACNTITVSCIDKLRLDFPHVPIIGTVPVIKTAGEITRNGRIGILSTTKTADSSYQKDLIKKFADGHSVLNIGTDELVPLIEHGEVDGDAMESLLRKVLAPMQKEGIDTLALGCTHFPFVEKEIQKILGDNVQILDSGAAIARQVKRVLEQKHTLSEERTPAHAFYTTAESTRIDRIAKKLLGITITNTTITI